MKVLVLVDGEHYPPVTRWGIAAARAMGHEPLAALYVGGTEKIAAEGPPDLGLPTIVPEPGSERFVALGAALDEVRPEAVLDLSDEPVLGYRERMELAAAALERGVPYVGSDFRLDPPVWAAPLPVPTLAVIGTGKRTGKTAIAGETARVAAAEGLNPMIVAMGRGGPPEPQVAEAGSVTVESLIERVRRGEHAASDYLEDALFTGVTTVGARRVGGGLAGMPFATNVREAGMVAAERGAGLVILEGSGSSIPPMPWDAGILVAPAGVPTEYLTGYLGPYRILRSDLFVITMASGSHEPKHLLPFRSHVLRLRADARYVETDFRPEPYGELRGKGVYLTTTAPPEAASRQVQHLEAAHGCRVVGSSTRLADRKGLNEDLDAAGEYDILVTELKAAAVDVACERAMARGAGIVFADNRPVTTGGDGELTDLLRETCLLAVERHRRG
ncbi:MAG TPA: 2,3-diphosphoglycerate synthetase [Actinomycetota bacterium]|nr:2,3-diphosphoglycerate synthetase [Actinomycetota bacterium]